MRLFSHAADFDVLLAITDMNPSARDLGAALAARLPAHLGQQVFGHMGDGNLHVGIGLPSPADKQAAESIVYGLVQKKRGAVSAEHGIGRTKQDWLHHSRTGAKVSAM